ncbi:hypothetical protein TL16_g12630 [Triparma laevis f. inornata]|uniref:Helicase ATP-binding domain-containing protein n=2 Tax=Triparma laevis TaxID=1534972 RepID=A0A9W7KXB2_9STRA|nr:hypothetical protein TL16_g12630 [Triparma laevis f. inornata]GMI14869.1 hypothetical protein TrLO_g7333 [Triparma laevis f. longispina]
MSYMDYIELKHLNYVHEKCVEEEDGNDDWLGNSTSGGGGGDWLSDTKKSSSDDWLSDTKEKSSSDDWLSSSKKEDEIDHKKLKQQYIHSHSHLSYLKNTRENLLDKINEGVSTSMSIEDSSVRVLKGRIKLGLEDGKREGVLGKGGGKRKKIDLEVELELEGYDSSENRGKGEEKVDDSDDSENEDFKKDAPGVTIDGFHFPAPSSKKNSQQQINLPSLLKPQNLHGVIPPSLPYQITALNQPLSSIYPQTPINSGLPKLYYLARTHSQLSQFLSELKRTPWKNVGASHLGSRKALCCNGDVNDGVRGEERVTEKCMDLAKNSGCSFKSKESKIEDLAFHGTSCLSDIEDLNILGRGTGTCGYYASRKGLAVSRIVCMTYGNMFSEESRRSLGVDLRGSIVVVDEAHNIPEALRQVANSRVSKENLERLSKTFKIYFTKYSERLSGKNLEYCRNLTSLISGFSKAVEKMSGEKPGKKVRNVNEFLFDCKVDNINLEKIIRYIERQELCRKLLGFYKKVIEAEQTVSPTKPQPSTPPPTTANFVNKHISPLSPFLSFLKRITSSSTYGKIIVEKDCLRYFLIQPSALFKQITQQAQAVVLAGGTLKPFKHLSSEILEDIPESITGSKLADQKSYSDPITQEGSVTFFSCDHVVSPSNVEMHSISKGPEGAKMDFRMEGRNKNTTIDDLGKIVMEGGTRCGRGTVLFLTSYKYEEIVVRRWRKTGLMERLKSKVKVYREPREARELENVLKSFSRDSATGSILICVIGGKMSEGINFSNDMARLIIVAGLPFPDITDEELKTKMKHLDESKKGITGSSYYFNLCMRAVNQSVGRAIRHKNDYASIWLVDESFEEVKEGLNRFLEGRRKAYA